MKWITRERVKVDRVACPWLIKHFVDKDAEFVFAPPDKVMDEAKRLDAIPYDVRNVELGQLAISRRSRGGHRSPWKLHPEILAVRLDPYLGTSREVILGKTEVGIKRPTGTVGV